MNASGVPEWPHKPEPPEQRRLLPERAMAVRGLGLAGLGAALGWGACASVKRLGLVGLVPAMALGGLSLLAGWAAAIHLTGGERFDDHPWV